MLYSTCGREFSPVVETSRHYPASYFPIEGIPEEKCQPAQACSQCMILIECILFNDIQSMRYHITTVILMLTHMLLIPNIPSVESEEMEELVESEYHDFQSSLLASSLLANIEYLPIPMDHL